MCIRDRFTATAANLISGTYGVTVVNDDGCAAISSVTINEPTLINATITETSGTNCANPNGGSADLSVSGGTLPYTYLWSNNSTNEDPQNLSAGINTVIITDANACSTSAEIMISSDEELPLAQIDSSPELNCNLQNIQLSATNSSTGDNFIYQWTTADGNILLGENSLAPTVNAAGTYQLEVINTENGCSSLSTISVDQNTQEPEIAVDLLSPLSLSLIHISEPTRPY